MQRFAAGSPRAIFCLKAGTKVGATRGARERRKGFSGDFGGMLKFMKPGRGAIKPAHLEAHEGWTRDLAQGNYLVEPWHCNLANGTFLLGPRTLALLGARQNPCGIIDLLRAHDGDDRSIILNILEQATGTPSSFCFSTRVRSRSGQASPLCCVGNSTLASEVGDGMLEGIFAFPDTGNC
ncbi:hypothetical protein ILFOPFJJ_02369 [Ensifer psoraleae]|nr:hypothetical protein [Sinorhizobium psoraleae]